MRPCQRVPLVLLALALLGAPAVRAGTWTRIGPEGGTISCLVSVPGRPATLYAGFLDGGIFRSDDRGASWQYAGSGSGRLRILALAGDARASDTLYAASGTLGVVRTDDGGRSWKAVTRGLPRLEALGVSAVAADGRSPGLVYAALRQGGLYRSVDGGKLWTALPAGAPRDVRLLVTDPRARGTVYAVGSRGLFKSTNAGDRWRPLRRGLEGYGLILSFHADPRNPQTLYVLAADSQETRLVKSTDGGAKWSPVGTPGNATLYSFALDPGEPSTLYLGALDGILRSRDGGRSWQSTREAPEGTQFKVWSAAASVIASPFEGGFFRSGDRGDHWTPATGIQALSSSRLAAAPGRLYTLTLGVERRSDDQGRTWSRLTPLADEPYRRFGEVFVLDPRTPSTVYAAFGETLARSSDGGDRWEPFSTPACLRPRVLVLDPVNPENLYVAGDIPLRCPFDPATACGVYRKLGQGEWECIRGELPGTGLPIDAVDPFAPSNLYTFMPDFILRSTDRGSHWSFVAEIPFLFSIALDPTRPGVIYAGFLGGTGRSHDGGATWDLSSAGLPRNHYVESLVVDPAGGATLYATTLEEVYRSDDEGRTWRRAAPGLEETVVRQIALDPTDPSVIYAATSGGGVLRLEQE